MRTLSMYQAITHKSMAFVLCVLLLTSCKDYMSEYFDKPEWISGNAYEVLQKEGKYKIFLSAVDRAGYKQLINGKGIHTVMAPSDSAFQVYLRSIGKNSIEEMDSIELKRLVGFHILHYAFTTSKLVNFRPKDGDDVSEDAAKINAGLYYKFRTRSKEAPTQQWDALRGAYVTIYHQDQFLPVFSYKMFETKQIDAKYNYEYFYSNSQWKGSTGFNVSNAAVTKYQLVANNGYVYLIDQVIKPMETIYAELKKQEKYSQFLDLYSKYEYFAEEPELTKEFGNGTKLYQHYHKAPLVNIACEWPAIDYSLLDKLSSTAYTIFAPSNDALNKFFDNYWKIGGYNSLSEVSSESVNYLLYNCIYGESVAFPEEIKNGRIKNSYNEVINVDVDAITPENRIMCVNGALYGCETLYPPAMFGSITGPAFQYKKYSYFLKMLDASKMTKTFTSNETRFLALVPSNEQAEGAGITLNRDKNLIRNNALLNTATQSNYVYAHTVSLDATPGSYQEIPTNGYHVMKNLSPNYDYYWYIKEGKLTNSFKYNELIFPEATVTEDELFYPLTELKFMGNEWSNGKVYSYEGALLEGSFDLSNFKSFQEMMFTSQNNPTPLYNGFAKLLIYAGMYTGQKYNFVLESCLLFVPTTQAIEEALSANKIPGMALNENLTDPSSNIIDNYVVTDQEALQKYLKTYFIPLSTSGISNYPFIGWNENVSAKGIPTLNVEEITDGSGKITEKITMLDVVDTGNKLTVRVMEQGHNAIDVLGTYHFFPFIFNDGCIHFITKCF